MSNLKTKNVLIVATACVGIPLSGLVQCKKDSGDDNQSKTESRTEPSRTDLRDSTVDARNNSQQRSRVPQEASKEVEDEVGDLTGREGVESLKTIHEAYSGDKLDQMMALAVDQLSESYSKSEILEILGALPPGRNKQKWIWSAVHKGQGSYAEDFFMVVDNLDYPEERRTAINAFTLFADIKEKDQFDDAFEFLSSQDHSEKDAIPQMKERLVESYIAGFYQDGASSAARKIADFPESVRPHAVRKLVGAFLWDGGVDEGMRFARSIVEDGAGNREEFAVEAYSETFEEIGSSKPQDFDKWFGEVPEDYRAPAARSYVDGWLQEDSIAASQWLLSQSTEIKRWAAPEVVSHLRHKGASAKEIEPWEALAESDADPDN